MRNPDGDVLVMNHAGLVLLLGGMVLQAHFGELGFALLSVFGAFLIMLGNNTALRRLEACREIIKEAGKVAP